MPGASVAGHNAELTPEIRNTVKNYMDQTFENILRKVGQTVRFKCGHPITDMVLSELVGSVLAWTFNNEPLIMDPSRMFFYKGNLDVADLTPSDTGVYECVVKWGPESMFENISVGVYSLQVTSETPTRYVFENDPMTLVCHSRTLGRLFPASARRWLLNETAVTSLPATLAENKTDELVPRIERKQAGVWECQVTHSRTNRTWGTAWLQIGVDDPPSFAARWYRAMVDHKALVFTIIGLVIIVSFVVFLYSAFRLKKTEDETEKEFIKERKGWQETLNNFVEKGEVTAADFPDPETDDESSLQDEEEDTPDADDGEETSESEAGMEEETDEESEEEEAAAEDEAKTADQSADDLADDSEDGGPVQSEANELDQIMTGDVDQSESEGADPNGTDQNDQVVTLEVDQGESDDAVQNDEDATDQILTAEVDQRGSDDAVPDGEDRNDPVVMGEVDQGETDGEKQNADQTNTNAWFDGVGSSPRADVRRSLTENVNECRTRASSQEKRFVRKRADVGSARRKPPKEKVHVALSKATAFEWLFKHSPHLKKLDSIMKEVSDVSLMDLDYSPPRHRGLVAPPGSTKPSKTDRNTVTGNRAWLKMCDDRKIHRGSHGHELQKSSKVENKTRGMIPGRSHSPECSKVVSDWGRMLEVAAKSDQVRRGSQSRHPAPWLPRFVERWRHSAGRDDHAGRRVKYTALTQDDYV